MAKQRAPARINGVTMDTLEEHIAAVEEFITRGDPATRLREALDDRIEAATSADDPLGPLSEDERLFFALDVFCEAACGNGIGLFFERADAAIMQTVEAGLQQFGLHQAYALLLQAREAYAAKPAEEAWYDWDEQHFDDLTIPLMNCADDLLDAIDAFAEAKGLLPE